LEEVRLSAKLCEHDGFYYLKIPDAVIDGFVGLIPDGKADKPAVAYAGNPYVGAHVSVIYPDETQRLHKKRRRVKEVGEEFDFSVDKMFVTQPSDWDGVQDVYFLIVKSPQLEALRKKYGLSRKINGHDFHVTVAVKTTRKAT
jgi:hypothetical protein